MRLVRGGSLLVVGGFVALLHCGGATRGGDCHGPVSAPVGRPQSVACPATTTPGFDAGITDACLTDGDCPTGQACGCAGQFGGNAEHFNECIPAQCRVNADCGEGGICSASQGGGCGSLTGFYCHTTADECATDDDCCGGATPMACYYAPTVGHFTCQAEVQCNG